jgi:hypothetical protein
MGQLHKDNRAARHANGPVAPATEGGRSYLKYPVGFADALTGVVISSGGTNFTR